MEKNKNVHPAYKEYDLEIKNSGELEEAKEISSVSSHEEVMERFNKVEGKEEIKNIEKDEEIKSLKKEIEELKSQIEKMKELGFNPEDKEFFLDTELVKKSYGDFAKLLTEKINDNSTYAKNFNEYLINTQPFLEKLSELEENPPGWFQVLQYRKSYILGGFEKIKDLFARSQKLIKEILLETQSLSENDEKLSIEDCYVKFIEKTMKINNFNNFNNDVLTKVVEKLSKDEKLFGKSYNNLDLLSKQIMIELGNFRSWLDDDGRGYLKDGERKEMYRFFFDFERKLFATMKNLHVRAFD